MYYKEIKKGWKFFTRTSHVQVNRQWFKYLEYSLLILTTNLWSWYYSHFTDETWDSDRLSNTSYQGCFRDSNAGLNKENHISIRLALPHIICSTGYHIIWVVYKIFLQDDKVLIRLLYKHSQQLKHQFQFFFFSLSLSCLHLSVTRESSNWISAFSIFNYIFCPGLMWDHHEAINAKDFCQFSTALA